MEGEYMKLKPLMGRWMFFKATGGSGQRKLSIIPIDSEGYSGRQLRMASNNGKNVLFLVPLQEELETAPLPFSSPEFSKMPKVACNNCLEIIPLQMLALHSESCQTAKEQTDKIIDVNDDEDDEGDDDADVDCTVGKGVKGTMVLKVSLVRSFNIEEDMDPNLPGSSSSNSTLPLPGPSTQTTEAPSEAVRLFMEDLRRGGDHQPPLRLTLNASDTDEERDGTLISFYKQRRETCHELICVKLLKEEWTEAESVRVAALCTEWYFPVPTKETNRLLLFQQLLSHAMVLKCIIWPEASIDSDDSEDEMSTTNINLISGFFRAFVKEASSDVLKGLMKFWTGWELPSPRLTFKVVRSRGHHHLPTASTCYELLRIPDHYKSGSALKLEFSQFSQVLA
ncbi:hypothetical protein D9C73_000150 [Collichthys lucidus]|uniref:HECT domain-containing protein n=1 Tax=Collichthys lucidus TaxID=240159 RepID=A0A4U5TWR4_COLLU|nr:hypothetical protein D9C73_000150 [Collichthys lucidus]